MASGQHEVRQGVRNAAAGNSCRPVRIRAPERAVLFYATDDESTATEVERLIGLAGFDAVQAGRVGNSGRIEVGGDLHAFGGLERPAVDVEEAETLVRATV